MRHSKNLDKIDSFLKPVLNVIIFHNLIVGWVTGLLKRGLVLPIKSLDLCCRRNMIHQSKSWHYLGPFQKSRMELFFSYSTDERKWNKFANIQTICYLSTLVLRDHSKWWAAKNEHEEGDGAHLNFCSNSNNERKILTHHEVIDRITEKIKSVITQMCKESKLRIHPNLRWPSFSLTFI